MANTLEFISDAKKATTTSTSLLGSEAQTVKDKPSLFDSLLSNSGSNANNEETTPTIKTAPVLEVKSEDNSEKELKTTSSLLDRMIIDAKKDIKTINNEEFKNLNTKINPEVVQSTEIVENPEDLEIETSVDLEKNNKIENKELKNPTLETIVKKDVKVEETLIEDVVENEENIKVPKIDTSKVEIKTEPNTEKELKPLASLLDKMILDTQKGIKTLSKEDLEVFNNMTNNQALIKPEVLEIIDEVKIDSSELIEKPEIKTDKKVEITTKEELKTLDKNIKEDVKITTVVVDNKEIEKQVSTNIIQTPEDNNILEDIEEPVIVVNKASKDEVVNTSAKTNIDEKLNVLNNQATSNSEAKVSLMDQLIIKNTNNIQSIIPMDKINLPQDEFLTKGIISNIYLSSQKNTLNNQELFNKNEAINLLRDAKSLNDVKTSAGMLDLGLEDAEIDVEQDLESITKTDINKKTDLDLLTRKNQINNMMLEKNIKNEDVKVLITKSIEASSALLSNTLELADDAIVSVNSPLSYNIQSKIIGARQQMSTMMSDIAKQMYENYKPPVTVFRINLNPLELGSIAILMKSDRNNALTISMNVSNNSTLEALVENQNALRTSLNKTFDENTKFNFDFSSSNQDKSQSKEQNNPQNQNRFEDRMNTQAELELKEENREKEEKSIDYM